MNIDEDIGTYPTVFSADKEMIKEGGKGRYYPFLSLSTVWERWFASMVQAGSLATIMMILQTVSLHVMCYSTVDCTQ